MEKPSKRSTRRPERHCLKCKNILYDEKWGEYKCMVLKRKIRNPDDYTGCKDYKKT